MGRTVAELDATMAASEFWRWAEFYQVHPFGEERADLRMGILASTVAGIVARKGKRFKPSDFMPRFLRKPRQDPHELERKAFRWLRGSGLKVKHGKRRDP